MSTVTSLAGRRPKTAVRSPKTAVPPRDTAEWLERADAEIARTAADPNQILTNLLAAGCKVTFAQCEDAISIKADITMPDGSVVSETGVNAVAALVFAYGAGAWLADLPSALAATSEAAK
jgi:hypothetical protein